MDEMDELTDLLDFEPAGSAESAALDSRRVFVLNMLKGKAGPSCVLDYNFDTEVRARAFSRQIFRGMLERVFALMIAK
jgi:hypothetical protein